MVKEGKMGKVRRFYIQNFGCRATQADGAALGSRLAHDGHTEVADRADADLVVLNTCTVTSSADDDVRQTVRRVHRENPEAEILVTGCYAQRAPRELSTLPGIKWVVGNSHKVAIPEIIARSGNEIDFHGEMFVGDITMHREFLSAPILETRGDRTRPNLKVQDGCDNRCSFCIIPSVRGPSRSAAAEHVVAQVRDLASRHREIVLSGINLGHWGRDAGKTHEFRLVNLVRRLLDETPVERLRLSSVEPMDFSDELLGVMAQAGGRVAAHVHAPLQSGCDATLKRMKRRYRSRHYAQRMERALASLPDAAFGADVMVGFPGETDSEFEQSARFIESMPFTYLHVFTYSERPGTPAAGYEGRVAMPVRKDRNRLLREIAAAKNLAFRRRFVGRTLSAVTLENSRALSTNFIQLELEAGCPANRLMNFEIGALTETGLRPPVLFPVLAG